MRSVRIVYEKLNLARYISHLDVNRCMQRSIKRANVPAWYTEGFNPHPYITFATPISLGYESCCELMDLKIADDNEIELSTIKNSLNDILPQGFIVTDIYESTTKICEVFFASFEIFLEDVKKEEIEKFLLQDEIKVMKKTKTKLTEIDIKPFLTDIKIEEQGKNLLINVTLPINEKISINPNLLTKAIISFLDNREIYLKIKRTMLFAEDLTPFK